MASRVKTPWLEQDLAYFGVTPLASRAFVPATFDADEAWGWAYVLEGATLGGRTLYPAAAARWRLGPDTGARYLHGYGDATGRMWNAFTRALQAAPLQGARADAVVAAANAAFGSLDALFRAG